MGAIWLTGGGEKMGSLVHQGRDVVPPEPKPEGAQLRDCLKRSDHLVKRKDNKSSGPIDRTATEGGVRTTLLARSVPTTDRRPLVTICLEPQGGAAANVPVCLAHPRNTPTTRVCKASPLLHRLLAYFLHQVC